MPLANHSNDLPFEASIHFGRASLKSYAHPAWLDNDDSDTGVLRDLNARQGGPHRSHNVGTIESEPIVGGLLDRASSGVQLELERDGCSLARKSNQVHPTARPVKFAYQD